MRFASPSENSLEAAHHLAERLDCDDLARLMLESLAGQLPPAAFYSVREQIELRRPENKTGYAINALRSMVSEGQYRRAA